MNPATALTEARALSGDLQRGLQAAAGLRFTRVLPELESALAVCLADPKTHGAVGLSLVGALSRGWWMQGMGSHGAALAERMLAAVEAPPDRPLAEALQGAGALAQAVGDYRRAEARYEAALALWTALSEEEQIAETTNSLGFVARELGDLERAVGCHRAALAIFTRTGPPQSAALAAHNLAVVAFLREDYPEAIAGHTRALATRRALGDDLGTASSLNNLGVIALFVDEEPERAESLLSEALQVRERLGDIWGSAASLCCRGQARLADPVAARADLTEGLRRFQEVGDRLGVCESLEGLAAADVAEGRLHRAGRLLGAAGAGRARLGLPLPAPRRAAHDRVQAAVDSSDVAVGEGLSLDEAAAQALC